MWFYSTGINRDKHVCWVRVGPKMPHPNGFEPLPPIGALYDGPLPWPGDIRFFPELRYRGCRVTPYSWHPTATEPILCVEIDPYDEDLSKRYFKRPFVDHIERCEALLSDGWDIYDPREGARKYVHVDELEKIEGPPPEGAF
jgi:hypothetical protein